VKSKVAVPPPIQINHGHHPRKTVVLIQQIGQTSTFELCSNLNIDRELLDSVLTEYEQERAWTVTNDTILTKARQNSILEDINKDITEHGCVSIIVKAQALGIPYQFLQKVQAGGCIAK
jgi:E3 UFM1-protein ligase 1